MTVSSPVEAILKFFDSYNRIARLYPAILALAPLIWSSVALFPSIIESASHSAAFVVAASCILYFLTSLTRSLGKRAELKLLQQWGAWPTTQLLRHRDGSIDGITLPRYHRALEVLCPGVVLPSSQQEAQNPAHADELYRSVTKRLIEQRRGPQYSMLHAENASYGFRRNLYGLKTFVIAESIILMALTAFAWWLIIPQPYTRLIIAESAISYPHFPVLLVLDIGYLCLWLWAVTHAYVKQAGQEYGEALLRTLDGQ